MYREVEKRLKTKRMNTEVGEGHSFEVRCTCLNYKSPLF